MTTAATSDRVSVHLRVNGKDHALRIPPYRTLLDCLRNDLALTGSKEGCSVGVCGACTVLVDGRMVSSCLMLAVMADGAKITTVEGLAGDGRLHPVQKAFVDRGGFQCGICTPGQVVADKALLDANPKPTESDIQDWMMGNLCRCTGYYQIVDSIQQAAAMAAGGRPVAARTPSRRPRPRGAARRTPARGASGRRRPAPPQGGGRSASARRGQGRPGRKRARR
jgi:carbon-monoxide dehydrogenase small subunit